MTNLENSLNTIAANTMTKPQLVTLMSMRLAQSSVALADYSACAVFLINNRFSAQEVWINLPEVMEAARTRRAAFPMRGVVAMLFASARTRR